MNKESETTSLLKEWYYEIALQIRKERVKEFEAKRLYYHKRRSPLFEEIALQIIRFEESRL